MARRVVHTSKIIGWPAVAMGVAITVAGVAVMLANGTNLLLVLGWGALGVFITGFHLASRLGYGPRLVNR